MGRGGGRRGMGGWQEDGDFSIFSFGNLNTLLESHSFAFSISSGE
jgi:hypothetical protein